MPRKTTQALNLDRPYPEASKLCSCVCGCLCVLAGSDWISMQMSLSERSGTYAQMCLWWKQDWMHAGTMESELKHLCAHVFTSINSLWQFCALFLLTRFNENCTFPSSGQVNAERSRSDYVTVKETNCITWSRSSKNSLSHIFPLKFLHSRCTVNTLERQPLFRSVYRMSCSLCNHQKNCAKKHCIVNCNSAIILLSQCILQQLYLLSEGHN